MRNRYKSLLSWALAAAMTAGLLPAPVAYAADDTANIKTVMLGTSGIQNPLPADPSNYNNHAPQSYIYFGVNPNDTEQTNRPIQWRVLDATKASADVPGGQGGTVPGMFLLSEYALAQLKDGFYGSNNNPPNKWEGSNAESWCNSFAESTGGYFTALESGAMLTTSKQETGGEVFSVWWGDSTRETNKAFFLSAQELSNYVAESNGAPSLITKQYHSSGGAATWWLLSPFINYVGFVGTVRNFGSVGLDDVRGGGMWARPALNLDSAKVLFTVPAGGVAGSASGLTAVTNYEATNGAREWKLTLKDTSRGFAVTTDTAGGWTMPQGSGKAFTYSGAVVGENEYISAILADNSGAIYYGKLAQAQADGANATAAFTLPDTVAEGEYTLYLFNEQENGARKSNLANDFTGNGIPLTVTPQQWTPSPPTPSTYPPSINQTDGGTVTLTPARPYRGDTVTITATPDAGKRVTFVGVTDRNGNVIEVTDNGNGTWTFTQPNSVVTVGVVFRDAVEPWRNPFGDVQESDWFYSAVEYVITHNLMNGVSFSTFAPDSEATRAMLWAILARMDGVTISGADWMAQAGAWATGAGVSDGTNPSAPLTREQLVTMLWRAAGSPPPRGDLSAFADADSVSEYARAPMAWATENGIVSGMGGNRLAPQAGATRAQLAAMLQRYAEK